MAIIEDLKEYRSMREEYKALVPEIRLMEEEAMQKYLDKEKEAYSGERETEAAILELYRSRAQRIKDRIHAVEVFVDNVQSSEEREIMRLRFIEGKTYQQIAFKRGEAGDGSTQMKKLFRYLKKWGQKEGRVELRPRFV